MRKRFSGMEQEAEAPAPVRDSGMCFCHGCPMPGSIAENANGGPPPAQRSWFCRFHFGEPPGKWSDITKRLRQHSILREPSTETTLLVAEMLRAGKSNPNAVGQPMRKADAWLPEVAEQ
jgi:hypothetical protein